jgi:Family of unknown function (DUF6248)
MSPVVTIPESDAEWIATKVLTRTYLRSCGGVKLVRLCRCQYGRCGHCGDGRHSKCTTRIGFGGNPPAGPHTHLVDRRGGAIAGVWTTGKPCRWVCSCDACAQAQPATPEAAPVAAPTTRGDLRPGDTVWLRPKTLGCPSICWKQPRAAIIALGYPYAVVKVGRKEYRIHLDNIRRSNPQAAKSVLAVRPKPRPSLPNGFTEQALF